ncbi:hypothetical protein INT45_013398 [Circinella minor]|uniref:Uncharacterized protein n=1 Tax=Circinella minor TaxID=1195481 RepID=A0A8H7VJ54_9FUNG|nr:hypothetical protein INT45_013398 [Circinella minor]
MKRGAYSLATFDAISDLMVLDGSRRASSAASMLHQMYLVESSVIRKQAHGIAIGGEDYVVAGRKCGPDTMYEADKINCPQLGNAPVAKRKEDYSIVK